MDKEFIPYEQAIALKELGFNKPCFGFWSNWGDQEPFLLSCEYGQEKESCEIRRKNLLCSAPTWHQAFKFFREKYKFRFNIDELYDAGCEILIRKDYINVVKIYDNQWSYEEAELQCLKKLIQIAIKKK